MMGRIPMVSNQNTREPMARGASDHKIRLVDRWRSYRAHHRATLTATLKKMLGEPIQTTVDRRGYCYCTGVALGDVFGIAQYAVTQQWL